MSMPGAFPRTGSDDSGMDTEVLRLQKDLELNSLHTKKLRTQRLGKDCIAMLDLISVTVIVICYLIDNSAFMLAVRYALQWGILKLEGTLDAMMSANEETIAADEEEVNARDSLTQTMKNLKENYHLGVKLIIVLLTAANLASHFFFYNLNTTGQDQYKHGFLFIDVIGESVLKSRTPLMTMDLVIAFMQWVLYKSTHANVAESQRENSALDDGYSGELNVLEVQLIPSQINKNFLVDWLGLDNYSHTLNIRGDQTYGSV